MDGQNTISVLLIEPERYPRMITIADTLEAMQELVGGHIEAYMPFSDNVAIICNDSGKVNGLPMNRAVYADDQKEKMIDIICGSFFMAYAPDTSEEFLSLPEEIQKKYYKKFRCPEQFARINNRICVIPFVPEESECEP